MQNSNISSNIDVPSYKEGDRITLVATKNGFLSHMIENKTFYPGDQLLEVEVTSVKTAKTILE